MLEIEHLSFDVQDEGRQSEILSDISFHVADGEMLVITGPNGGGKSTLAKLLMGINESTAGKIILNGEDITGLSINERAQAGIGFAFQQPPRFKGMTVRRLLNLAAGRSLSENECCGLLSSVGLCAQEYIDREADATLSGGEMKRIEIATVLAKPHNLCIFDEPEAGIDLWSFSMLIKKFEQIHKEKKESLILISHQERIIRMADRIMVISDGKIDRIGPAEEILPTLLDSSSQEACCMVSRKEATTVKLNQVTEDVLKVIDSYGFKQEGAYNLRLNGMAVCHGDSRHIAIVKKTDLPGIDIKISGEAQNEQVHIPVVMSEPGLDVVYNDFYVEDGADVTIVAGLGIHGEGLQRNPP